MMIRNSLFAAVALLMTGCGIYKPYTRPLVMRIISIRFKLTIIYSVLHGCTDRTSTFHSCRPIHK